jgi:uncharacterized DUF497 family protein
MPAFEWDEAKNRANRAKHGIPFESVRSCFSGPLLVSADTRFEYGEARWLAIALLDVVPIVIAYTERKGRIRIISARKANRHERKIFEAHLAKIRR